MAQVGVVEAAQDGLFPEPTRLFTCTPSRLVAFEDCPRRYRFTYLDRPPPPKGPPWAHNSLGASVHTALRAWFDLPPDRRTPGAVDSLLRPTWVRDGYRDEEQETLMYGRARQLARRLPGRAGSRLRAARRRAHGGDQDPDAGAVRAGGPARRRGRRAGDCRLQDRPYRSGPRRRPRVPGARPLRHRRLGHVPAAAAGGSSCTTCRPARSPPTSTPTSPWPGTCAGPSRPPPTRWRPSGRSRPAPTPTARSRPTPGAHLRLV